MKVPSWPLKLTLRRRCLRRRARSRATSRSRTTSSPFGAQRQRAEGLRRLQRRLHLDRVGDDTRSWSCPAPTRKFEARDRRQHVGRGHVRARRAAPGRSRRASRIRARRGSARRPTPSTVAKRGWMTRVRYSVTCSGFMFGCATRDTSARIAGRCPSTIDRILGVRRAAAPRTCCTLAMHFGQRLSGRR